MEHDSVLNKHENCIFLQVFSYSSVYNICISKKCTNHIYYFLVAFAAL